MNTGITIQFPKSTGLRCLMMPYIQGQPESVPKQYQSYYDIIKQVFIKYGDVGYLTIDESPVQAGSPHRGTRAKFDRALHTEVGRLPNKIYAWGGGGWSGNDFVELEKDVEVLLANNLDNSCAVWNGKHEHTSKDGDIGDEAHHYPLREANLMRAGEVHKIGIFTPHESLPVTSNFNRQFLRIVSKGVHGREPYFTINPLLTN